MCSAHLHAAGRTHALDLGPPSKTADNTVDASCEVPEADEKSSSKPPSAVPPAGLQRSRTRTCMDATGGEVGRRCDQAWLLHTF